MDFSNLTKVPYKSEFCEVALNDLILLVLKR